jgi:hypothetical protein
MQHLDDTQNTHELTAYIETWQTIGDVAYIHSLCQCLEAEPTPEAINQYLITQGHKPRSVPRLAAMLQECQELITEFHSPRRRLLMDDYPTPEAYQAAFDRYAQAKQAQRAAQWTTGKQRKANE